MRLRSFSFAAVLVGFVAGLAMPGYGEEAKKSIRVGIIGLDTSHVIAFTKVMNDPAAKGDLADVQVVAAYPGGSPDIPSSWDRVGKYTDQLREQGIKIFDSIEEMLKHVDAVLLESLDGRPHLEQAKPVIAAKKPMFIDKPMAGSLADGMEIFRLAKEAGSPVFSSSSLRFASGLQDIRDGKSSFGEIKSCVARSPMSLEPHHPDLFWYGIHGVEMLFTVMGAGCKEVKRLGPEEVEGIWNDGRIGKFVAQKGYGVEIVGTKGSGEVGKYEGYQPLVERIAAFFKTGKPPVCAEETLEILAFMEAADESKAQNGAPVTIQSVMEKAKKKNAERQ
ncbi:MAG: Gfo/Idh/MocA family oxidoreductase [Pirellulales bacterium]|nr:Gfo/Idh/MocA family oxidoreductase [Pirellulales bacterium]